MLKGLMASTDIYTQPKGTFPRGSNLLLNKRGALDVCDGSQLVHAFNGQVQSNRGRMMASFLFSPTGVARYYLALAKALDIPLGAPQNLSVVTAVGGTLAAGNYFYKVTALDGAGGETTASNEVNIGTGANGKNTLTWNVVPNAQGYNVYRGNVSTGELLLLGGGLPAPQVAPGSLTVTYVDTGAASAIGIALVSAALVETKFVGFGLNFKQVSTFVTSTPHGLSSGQAFTIFGVNPNAFNQTYLITAVVDAFTVQATTFTVSSVTGEKFFPAFMTGSGGSLATQGPPNSDTTQQTALFKMPVIVGTIAVIPVSYDNSDIVALFPADPLLYEGGGGGGPGGGGGRGGGGSGGGGGGGSSPTPSGGIPGNVTTIPQMIEFTNRVVLGLGNGFPPQLFSDPVTPVNPATVAPIQSVSVDAFGVVTVTTTVPHGLVAAQVGANVVLAGITNPLFNTVGPTLQIVSPTQFKIRNLAAIGQANSSGGTSTTTAVPVTSSFVPAFPTWGATILFNTNSIVQPSPANGHYYKAVQGGTSGAAQPTFPTGTGQQVADGSVIWQEAGGTNTAAPPPPGAGQIWVYAGSLWVLNTSPSNTANGLDGPCSLRMSDVNNPTSWNPINQAFLDKDDGTEGTGLMSFTITAQGIPPEGSLIAFKNYATYQIVGVFGSPNLTIQRVKTTMGCLAPRSIQFVPGFGIMRFCHLGFAVFDGVEDRVNSEEIRPFLFPTNDFNEADIVVLDANFQAGMWGFQTANPPMFCAAVPIGSSGGQLTRIFCFDLVLKAWAAPVDLPFPISTAAQFTTISANPVTILGGFSDGLLSRWQASDDDWDTGATGARSPSAVTWSVKLPEVASQGADQKLNCRRLVIRGISTDVDDVSPITVTPVVNGVSKPTQTYPIPGQGDFEVFASFMRDGLRFSAIIAGQGQVELDRFTFHVFEKSVGAAKVIA